MEGCPARPAHPLIYIGMCDVWSGDRNTFPAVRDSAIGSVYTHSLWSYWKISPHSSTEITQNNRMPSTCIVASYINTMIDGFSLHWFPSDPKFRRIWTAKVKLTRRLSGRNQPRNRSSTLHTLSNLTGTPTINNISLGLNSRRSFVLMLCPLW